MLSSKEFAQRDLYFVLFICALAATVSVLFSVIAILGDEVVNTDGVMYLRSALFFYSGDWVSGFAADYTKFPLYSMAIALTAHIAGLSVEHAAYAVNIFFDAASVVVFMLLVCELSNRCEDRHQLIIAAAITVLSFTQFNDYRTLIVRDHGFWFFYLSSILLFIYYWQKPNLSNALVWGGVSLMSSLFRIEGIIFLLALPVSVLLKSGNLRQRIVECLRAYAVLLPCFVVALGIVLYGVLFSEDAYIVGNSKEALMRGTHYLSASPWEFLTQKSEALSGALFTDAAAVFSKKYAFTGVIAVLSAIFFSKIFSALTLVFTLLIIYTVYFRVVPSKPEVRICYWAVFINLLIVLLFLVNQFFLVGRYVVPLVFILILIVPFGLCFMYEQWQMNTDRRSKVFWVFPVVCIALFGMAVDGIVSFGPSKQYVRDAANWLNVTVPSEAVLISDNAPLLFHSGISNTVLQSSYDADQKVSGITGKHVYWAVKVSRKASNYERDLHGSKNILPIKKFQNKRGDRILIYHFTD